MCYKAVMAPASNPTQPLCNAGTYPNMSECTGAGSNQCSNFGTTPPNCPYRPSGATASGCSPQPVTTPVNGIAVLMSCSNLNTNCTPIPQNDLCTGFFGTKQRNQIVEAGGACCYCDTYTVNPADPNCRLHNSDLGP